MIIVFEFADILQFYVILLDDMIHNFQTIYFFQARAWMYESDVALFGFQ